MKKFGFTMPELIITLGIVGVAAAVAAPVLGNLMPDKNKLKAIECYNLVNAATEEFLSDEGIYYGPDELTYHKFDTDGSIIETLTTPEEFPDGYPDCEALMCFENHPLRVPYVNENLTGTDKYRGLLFIKYGLTPEKKKPNGDPRYETGTSSDGTKWDMKYITIKDADNKKIKYMGEYLVGYKIEFDVNPNNNNDKDASCIYDKNNCKSPDKFRIYVNHEGNIFAGDPMMEAYLANPLNMNTKKEDKAAALRFANSGKDYDNPNFLYTKADNNKE